MLFWMAIAFFSLSTTFSDFYVSESDQSCYQVLLEQKFLPDDTIIAFDWHEVVQEQNHFRIASKLALHKKWAIWRALNPFLLKKILRAVKHEKKVAEHIIKEIEDSFDGFGGLEDAFIDIVNDEPLIAATVQIIKDLKKAGFKLYMLSNIAPETLEKLKLLHPDVLQMFDGFYTPSEANDYIQKPNLEFYKKFKDFLVERGEGKKKILFIDDREKNIKAAIEEGFYGVVFSSSAQLNSLVNSLQLVKIGA